MTGAHDLTFIEDSSGLTSELYENRNRDRDKALLASFQPKNGI